MSEKVPGEKPGLLIHYTVDDALQSTTRETLTPREILANAGIDAETHFLTLVEGTQRQNFHDPDQPISMREHMTFTTGEKTTRTRGRETAARATESGLPGGGQGRSGDSEIIPPKELVGKGAEK